MKPFLPVALFLAASSTCADETFLPADVSDAKMFVCGVGGNADGTADAIGVVEFVHGGSPFRIIISRRATPTEAMNDCTTWFQKAKEKWHKK